ncbi:hypothetical protein OS190_15425 [Sulfitobacter sp. F26204]|uniref:hypothetical protein n=1 Tax=Sulfitobacter sp. F26204 TaxID=2996014 RepID=UPI00225E5B93|nr:hypothetical protein [Sulfitobacter sp. F26204]MCX7560958.1 hypothetical protein [Sulfitobacter sp. F26204]
MTGVKPHEPACLNTLSVTRLFTEHAKIEAELRARNVIRSANSPVGDYAETLFCTAFGWQMQGASVKGYDALDSENVRYQIKARKLNSEKTSRQL